HLHLAHAPAVVEHGDVGVRGRTPDRGDGRVPERADTEVQGGAGSAEEADSRHEARQLPRVKSLWTRAGPPVHTRGDGIPRGTIRDRQVDKSGAVVDLWDLFRVLFRRWYLTVPLLVLVAGVGYYSAKGIEPTYTASAGGVFLEPVVLLPVEQRAPNPWAQAGVATTAAAVVGSVVDPVTKEQVVAEGYSGDYSVQLASRSVLFSIYAPAASHEAAIATLDHVIELMKEDLRAKQSAYGVPENQQINIQLASGTSIVSTREGVSRVLLGLGGLGAVLTVGI